MTATIPRTSTTGRSDSLAIVIAILIAVALLGAAMLFSLRSGGSSPADDNSPAEPAAYVAGAADLFEQRASATNPRTYLASPSDLFEQRVAVGG